MNTAIEVTIPGPRERLLTALPEELSEAELLGLLLGTGGKGEPVTRLADRLLRELGGLHALARMHLGELTRAQGLGPSKAARLVAGFELGRRAASRPLPIGRPLTSSADVAALMRPLLASMEQERFVALPTDARNRPLGRVEISRGGLSSCAVAPADVFRALLRRAASGAVFVHNHPSGDPSPSPDDIALTDHLRQAGELVGLRVLDHVIVATEGYFSFADAGLLPGEEVEDVA